MDRALLEERYKAFREAIRRAGENDLLSMTIDEFEEWIAEGPMKGDGKSYLTRGVWPRFRDISDFGRSQIVNVKSDDTADTLQLEVLPRGWYWFTLGLARQHYARVNDPDYWLAVRRLGKPPGQ